uniref:Reverse transcriptase zinc-binding domain-containing protein n=1 Tax=Oryza brachyantha TaxID=4533 RepID=J3L8V8_ORYBR
MQCSFSNRVWALLRGWMNLPFQLPRDFTGSLSEWWATTRKFCRKRYRANFDSAIALACWLLWIWKERNARIFNNVSRSPPPQWFGVYMEEIFVWKAAEFVREPTGIG